MNDTDSVYASEKKSDVFILIGCLGLLIILGAASFVFIPGEVKKHVSKEEKKEPKDKVTLAAGENEAWAQFRLGVMYSTGTERKKNMELAFQWFEKAATQGHSDAQFELGRMFENGSAVKADILQAYYWTYLSYLNGNKLAKAKLRSLEKNISLADVEKIERKANATIPTENKVVAPSSNNQPGQILGK